MVSAQQRIEKAISGSPLLRYLITGGSISVIDFSGFLLFTQVLGLNEIVANVLSTAIAMSVSFAINSTFVFRSTKRTTMTFLLFVSFTAFTGLVLQSAVIFVIVGAAHGIAGPGQTDMIVPASKVVAMAIGAVANFVGYRFLLTPRR